MSELMEFERIFKMACVSNSTVLIEGETGTGKSYLAKRIHECSERKGKPFIIVNLATLHEGTLESELFGHEKGAFTGAERKRIGRIQAAHGGTVFLDEIGDLSPRMQARLLEFLNSKVISSLGSNQDLHVDVKVIAATHRDLRGAVAKGQFREDLFHRLQVISLRLPPLREHMDLLDGLVSQFLQEWSHLRGNVPLRVSQEVLQKFKNHSWPGNIRELKNVVEYCSLASQGPEITYQDLPNWMQSNLSSTHFRLSQEYAPLGVAEIPLTFDYYAIMERLEKDFLGRVLERNSGKIDFTARQIGLNKTTLIRRVRAYGLRSWGN